jgi:diguanylate cyclase (GGDEF)-like protein
MRVTSAPIRSLIPRIENIYAASRTITAAAVLFWMLTSSDAALRRPELLYGVTGFFLAFAIFYLLSTLKLGLTRQIATVSVAIDILFVTFLIRFTGGPASTFYLLYYMVIMFSSYYFSLNVGVGVSFAVILAYVLTNPNLATRVTPAELGLRLLFAWFFAWTVGYVSGYIKRSELRLLKLLDSLNESTTELERSQVRVETVYETARALGGMHHEDEITDEVLNIVQSVLSYEVCSIMVLDFNSRTLVEVARLELGRRKRGKLLLRVTSEGVLAEVVDRTAAKRVFDIAAKEDYTPVLAESKSSLIVPMVARGKVLGVLIAEATMVNQFTEMDQKVFAILASEAGMAYENSRLHQELEKLVVIDDLTDVYNYRFFNEKLTEEARRAARYSQPLSLIMVDLDSFKHCNDTYGHEVGNQVLRGVSRAIMASVRDIDTVARYGGEEFIVILPQTEHDDAVTIAERIRSQIEAATLAKTDTGEPIRVTASVGLTTYPDNGCEVDNLVRLVDQAMYRAKGAGKNRVAAI